jgi:SAM-dependent methyltransferase
MSHERAGVDRRVCCWRALRRLGHHNGRLLDIGSGVGALTFELLERGLTEAVGVDLSSAYVAAAAAEAARRGRTDSVRFVHGDFVGIAGQFLAADIVTLDRSSAVTQNTSGSSMNRPDTRLVASLSRIHETSGTSELGLDCKTSHDRFAGIRFGRSSIQLRLWSTSFAEQASSWSVVVARGHGVPMCTGTSDRAVLTRENTTMTTPTTMTREMSAPATKIQAVRLAVHLQ